MTISLSREEIESAIRQYVVNNILSYHVTNTYDIKVSQGKTAYANVRLVEKGANDEPKEILDDSDIEAGLVAPDITDFAEPQIDEEEAQTYQEPESEHPAQTKMFV